MKKIFIILFCVFIASPAFAGTSSLHTLWPYFKDAKMVQIPSYNSGPFPNEFITLKDGSYKKSPVKIDALIAYPKKGEGPFPVLVFNHASGGSWQWSNEWFKFDRLMARQLLKKGIAVMFVDNFNGRSVVSADEDQSQVSTYSFYIDAFMTLEYLSKDPRVNIKKVGITGWSRGGMNSLAIAEKRIRDALISKDLYFAAAQPRAPDCENVSLFGNPQPIKETKTWMVLGGADDYTRAEPCVEYGKKVKANGGDIEVTVKKGWHHGFLGNYPRELSEDAEIYWKCPRVWTEDNGKYNKEYIDWLVKNGAFESEEAMWEMAKNDPGKAYKRSGIAFKKSKCIFLGAHTGGDKGGKFMKPFLKFWEETLLN